MAVYTECLQFKRKLAEAIRKCFCELKVKDVQKYSMMMIRLHRYTDVADFTVPSKCLTLGLSLTTDGVEEKKEILAKTLDSIPKASNLWPYKVTEAKLDPENGILLKLDRIDTFRRIITKNTSQIRPKLFFSESGKCIPSVLIISACGLKAGSKNPTLEERNQLRCQVITYHLRAVCKMLGMEVDHLTMPDDISPAIGGLIGGSRRDDRTACSSPLAPSSDDRRRSVLDTFVKRLEGERESEIDSSSRDGYLASSEKGEEDDRRNRPRSSTVVNLKDVLRDQDLPCGSRGYMTNLGDVEALTANKSPTKALRECVMLESAVTARMKQKDTLVIAVHISSPSQSYHQQSVDLLWRSLSETARNCRPVHATVGPVSVVGPSESPDVVGSMASLTERYQEELREASTIKYGNDIQDFEEEIQKRSVLANAAIKFDILSTALGSVVKLDFSRKDQTAESSRPGIFVLYNYARLAALFKKFENQVQEGIYPPLPPVDEVKFDCLRDEEEWKLLFRYVLQYPNVVLETLGDLFATQGPRCNLYPNKVCRFLQSLSRDLSIYYSRTHILLEPRPQLLPVIFARLYLLKSVMRVMEDGLSLLDIEPLSQM